MLGSRGCSPHSGTLIVRNATDGLGATGPPTSRQKHNRPVPLLALGCNVPIHLPLVDPHSWAFFTQGRLAVQKILFASATAFWIKYLTVNRSLSHALPGRLSFPGNSPWSWDAWDKKSIDDSNPNLMLDEVWSLDPNWALICRRSGDITYSVGIPDPHYRKDYMGNKVRHCIKNTHHGWLLKKG